MHLHKQRGSAQLITVASLLAYPTLAWGVADWPQWRGPNRDGLVVDASIPRTWPKELKQEWKVPVGVGLAAAGQNPNFTNPDNGPRRSFGLPANMQQTMTVNNGVTTLRLIRDRCQSTHEEMDGLQW